MPATESRPPQLPAVMVMVLPGNAARRRVSRSSYCVTLMFCSQSMSTPSYWFVFTKLEMLETKVAIIPGEVLCANAPRCESLSLTHTRTCLPAGLEATTALMSA